MQSGQKMTTSSAKGSGSRAKSTQQVSVQAMRKRNQRRVTKARVTADLLRSLPEGVTYSPDSDEPLPSKSKDSKY